MTSRRLFRVLGLVGLTGPVLAGPTPAITDEAAVAPYALPDPLRAADGMPIRDGAAWRTKRRPELLELFAREVYGRTPAGRPAAMRWEMTSIERGAFGGRATRKQVTIWFSENRAGPQMHLLVYQPNRAADVVPANDPLPRAWPVFLGLNFFGNHTVNTDPGIALAEPFTFYDVDHYQASPEARTSDQRGVDAAKWPLETILARGYAVVTAYRADLCPDRVEGLTEAVPALFGTGGAEKRAADAWGTVGAWAWGLSRALDWIESDPDLDAKRVTVHGFSRLGKAAIWAAAQDERFALLVSFESGCGGAALSKRVFGETVAIITDQFPHWFAKNFRRYNDQETALPVDQHELLALVAPRPLLVTSAAEDLWSDPRGEFLGAQAASPVWALFGRQGIDGAEMPAIGSPVGETVSYFVRAGKHDVTTEDWARALDFADRHLR